MKKIFKHIQEKFYDIYGPLFFILISIGSVILIAFKIIIPCVYGKTYKAIEKVEIYENRELIETYTNVEDISGYTIYFENGNKLLVNEHCNIKIYYVELCEFPDSKYCPFNGDHND